jgi:hypothetical protein
MLSSRETVLGHLTARLTERREDAATMALAFILSRSKVMRDMLATFLRVQGQEVRSVGRVVNQQAASRESRPDLTCFDPGDKVVGFVEAKFWAGLTDSQPKEYLDRLEEAGGGTLLVVAPEKRLPSLWTELLLRLQAGQEAGAAADAERVVVVRPGICLRLVSWRRLLEVLAEAARVGDPVVSADVEQLWGLCAAYEEDGFIPLTREELDDLAVPRRILMLGKVVRKVVEQAKKENVVLLGKLKATHCWEGAGQYLKIADAGGWLGIDHKAWARFGQSPLWLKFSGGWGRAADVNRALQAWSGGDRQRLFEHEGTAYVSIEVLAGASEDQVVKHAVDQLRQVRDLLIVGGVVERVVGVEPPPEAAE